MYGISDHNSINVPRPIEFGEVIYLDIMLLEFPSNYLNLLDLPNVGQDQHYIFYFWKRVCVVYKCWLNSPRPLDIVQKMIIIKPCPIFLDPISLPLDKHSSYAACCHGDT